MNILCIKSLASYLSKTLAPGIMRMVDLFVGAQVAERPYC